MSICHHSHGCMMTWSRRFFSPALTEGTGHWGPHLRLTGLRAVRRPSVVRGMAHFLFTAVCETLGAHSLGDLDEFLAPGCNLAIVAIGE